VYSDRRFVDSQSKRKLPGFNPSKGAKMNDRYKLHFNKSYFGSSMVFKIKEPKRGAPSKIHIVSMIGDELLTLCKFLGEEPVLRYFEFFLELLFTSQDQWIR